MSRPTRSTSSTSRCLFQQSRRRHSITLQANPHTPSSQTLSSSPIPQRSYILPPLSYSSTFSYRASPCRLFANASYRANSQPQGPNRIAGFGSPSANPRHKLNTKDRGPASKEDTQTDFAEMNVLGSIAAPTTSVDTCLFDGFQLDSGLHVGEGDGVVLVGGEGFVWRPWMANSTGGTESTRKVVNGNMMQGNTETERTGGVLNQSGQFEVAEHGWGVFSMLWPRPDLLIVGTGRTIRPLAPSTRAYLQTLGMRLEVLDTRNAASQFNMLATERGVSEVAAALVPIGFGIK